MKIRVATTVQKESFMFQIGLALKSAMGQSLETVTCAFLRRRRQSNQKQRISERRLVSIDPMQKWLPLYYSFVRI